MYDVASLAFGGGDAATPQRSKHVVFGAWWLDQVRDSRRSAILTGSPFRSLAMGLGHACRLCPPASLRLTLHLNVQRLNPAAQWRISLELSWRNLARERPSLPQEHTPIGGKVFLADARAAEKQRFDGLTPVEQAHPHQCMLEVDVVCVDLDSFSMVWNEAEAR